MADKTAKLDQVGPEKSQEGPSFTAGGTTRAAPGGCKDLTESDNGPTQLHPFGGAGSKTPTGRVTGAHSSTHGPLCLCSPLKRPTRFSHGVSFVESMEEANTLHAYVCRMMMTIIGKLVPSCDKLGSKLGPCWGKLGQPRWDQIVPTSG